MTYRHGIVWLWIAIAASGIACVYAKHEARKLFVELQGLESTRDELNIEWGQLQIEQSTWSTHGRVESLAREELDMSAPAPADVVVVKP